MVAMGLVLEVSKSRMAHQKVVRIITYHEAISEAS
jgi:hypothetical protein